MPDSLTTHTPGSEVEQPTVVQVPLVNPPGAAPGRTDILYDHESTPMTRAAHEAIEQQRDAPRNEALARILADTVPREPAALSDTLFMPWRPARMHQSDSPFTLGNERGDCGRHIIEYRLGLCPEERPALPGYDSPTMALLLALFLLIAANFRHYSTFIKTFAHDLWSVRRRGNVFDDHTVSESRAVGSLLLLVFVCEGILLCCGVGGILGMSVFDAIMMASGVAAAYYVWQLAAYSVTGYAFAGKVVRRQWIKGFNASQCLLGMTLVVPAVVALFSPLLANAMCIAGAVFYATARIVFICKGFRLFYDNFGSILYFILYLCTLEIAPLFLLIKTRSEILQQPL